MKDLKIGLVARCDNSGLGTLSQDFYKHLPISKTLVVQTNYENYPERFKGGIVCERGIPSLEEIEEFLEGLNLVLTFETPYNYNLLTKAKEKGVKTIIIPNYEWAEPEDKMIAKPDLFLCPSKLDYDEMPEPKKYLPIPIDREKFPFKLRTKAETFVFNNGHGGFGGRNSLAEFLQAIPLIKSDVKFIIRSQVFFQSVNDTRVKIEMGEIEHKKLWEEGDVFVFPHKFDGLSLPIQEALSAGYPIISTNIYPHNTYLPKELLFEPETMAEIKVYRKIEAAIISPVKLANKIEEWANKNITEFSKKSNELAEKWSWKNLLPEYLKVFKELIKWKKHL